MSPAIWSALLVARSLAAGVLAWRGLARPHAALLAYLLSDAIFTAAIRDIPNNSPLYLRVWGGLWIPLSTALAILMGLQAYQRSLELFPAVRKLSHQILLSLCVAAAGFAQFFQSTYTVYGVFSRLQQGVTLALAVFGLAMIPLLNHYYSPRRRPNARRQEWILAAHYTLTSAGLIALHRGHTNLSQVLIIAETLGCGLAWMLLLTKSGESVPTPPPEPARRGKQAALDQFAGLQAGLKGLNDSK